MNIKVLRHRLRAMSIGEIAYRFRLRLTDSLNFGVVAKKSKQYADHGYLDHILSGPLQSEPDENSQNPLYQRSVSVAEKALDGKLSVFSREIGFERIPDWLADPFAGKRADGLNHVPSWGERYRKTGLDIRAIWQLNRLQVLVNISRAWLVTGREEFAGLAVDWIEDWNVRNPYGRTVNWTNGLEVSLRSIAIMLTVNGLRNSNFAKDDRFKARVSRLLYCHGAYIEGHLSPESSGFNHLLGEAAGLALIGNFMPEFPRSKKWRNKGFSIMRRCIKNLILPDGGGLEGSLGYLEIICRITALTAFLCKRPVEELFDRECLDRLKKAYRFIAEMTDGGELVSEFGDNDDSWIPGLYACSRQERYLSVLNLLSIITGNGSPSHRFRLDEETLWLCGNGAGRDFPVRSEVDSAVSLAEFIESGHYVARPWPGAFLRFECGHWGDGRIWAHAHADRLSFSLFLNGSPIFVDPGTGYYLADCKMRNYFRSSRAHNTVSIDGASQGNALAAFLWEKDIESGLTELSEDEKRLVLSGWVKDFRYDAKNDRLIHYRTLTALKNAKEIVIEDRIETDISHEVEVIFTLHPDCEALIEGNQVVIRSRGELVAELIPDQHCRVALHRGETEPLRGCYSRAFYEVEPCRQVVCSKRIGKNTTIKTVVRIEI